MVPSSPEQGGIKHVHSRQEAGKADRHLAHCMVQGRTTGRVDCARHAANNSHCNAQCCCAPPPCTPLPTCHIRRVVLLNGPAVVRNDSGQVCACRSRAPKARQPASCRGAWVGAADAHNLGHCFTRLCKAVMNQQVSEHGNKQCATHALQHTEAPKTMHYSNPPEQSLHAASKLTTVASATAEFCLAAPPRLCAT